MQQAEPALDLVAELTQLLRQLGFTPINNGEGCRWCTLEPHSPASRLLTSRPCHPELLLILEGLLAPVRHIFVLLHQVAVVKDTTIIPHLNSTLIRAL